MSHQEFSDKRRSLGLEARLAAYVSAAGGVVAMASGDAEGAVVGNSATIPFGINSETNIDFNADDQADFQIDHDRYNLNGNNLDYLQIDKNDVNSEANPFPTDFNVGFPAGATTPNETAEAAYLIVGEAGSYPAALTAGSPIGPDQTFDFQEGDNFLGGGKTIRANRLIDEDHTQIDQADGGKTPDQVQVPFNGPNFVGLGGEVRYLGLKMDLNNADADGGGPYSYGWIGIRIDNEADATGAVVGYGYETTPGTAILAGDTGPFTPNADYDDDGDVDGNDFLVWQRENGSTVTAGTGADGNGDGQVNGGDLTLWRDDFGSAVAVAASSAGAVPEPDAALMGGLGGLLMLAWCVLTRRIRNAAKMV